MFVRASEVMARQLLSCKAICQENFEIYRYGFQQGLTIMLNAATMFAMGIVWGKHGSQYSLCFCIFR